MPPHSKSQKRKRSPPTVTLTDEQERQIQDAFDVFDTTNTGTIRTKQARYAIQSLGLTVNKKEVQSRSSDNDTIDLAAFTQLAGTKLVKRAKALRAFDLFDRDGKGVVCFEDLQRIAQELGESMSERELEEMLDDADKEGNGFLSKQDFLTVAESLNL